MEYKNLRKMLLLEAIGKDGKQNQRSLSRKLNMSLGMVCNLIGVLQKSGMLDLEPQAQNKVSYELTDNGVEEIKRLQMQYTSHSIMMYKKMKEVIRSRLAELIESGYRKFVIYGLSEFCEIVTLLLEEEDTVQRWVIDNKNAGKYVCGLKIGRDSELKHIDYDAVLITGLANPATAHADLIRKGVPEYKIFTIYDPDTDDK